MLIVTELIGKYLMTVDGVANYYTESILRQASYDEGGLRGLYVRGFHPSAPVIFLFPGTRVVRVRFGGGTTPRVAVYL